MYWCLNFTFLFLTQVLSVRAQMSLVEAPVEPEEATEDFTWWYLSLFVLTAALIGAVIWVMKTKKEKKAAAVTIKKIETNRKKSAETNSLDFDKELEWLTKNQKLVGKSDKKSNSKSPSKILIDVLGDDLENIKTVKLEKPDKILPVFLIEKLELSSPYNLLPLSNEQALMSAIEQTQDEFEEDEAVRGLALRILTAFKTRNSVEALSQMALYDLSASLRSKAVSILSEFNHESVFETLLQASADPTREVRAAAARALSKLTIDRADAWSRIYESGEKGRLLQAARAAIESGIVKMSFERLVHLDEKYSYEAFVLMVLLINAGETQEIFQTLKNHKNLNVGKALLHAIKLTKNQAALEKLSIIFEEKTLPPELQKVAGGIIEEFSLVAA
jgi:HEAT repeats